MAASVRAKGWRSFIGSMYPDLWLGITEYLTNLSPVGRDALFFPEIEFLELTVNCDSAVEGWLILPIAELSPALRF